MKEIKDGIYDLGVDQTQIAKARKTVIVNNNVDFQVTNESIIITN